MEQFQKGGTASGVKNVEIRQSKMNTHVVATENLKIRKNFILYNIQYNINEPRRKET